MKKLLIDLLKIPSISSDTEQLHKIVDYVGDYFKWTNAIIERFEFNNKPSIVIKNFDWKKADIVLNGHLDVVPPSQENQFNPVEKDGRLYARGAWDMKAWDAIMIKLMKDLLDENYKDKKISLILTTDEEVWWFDGVAKLVELWYTWDVVLIPDSGSKDRIVYAEKWILHLDIDFYGHSAHASRPWLWENAIDNMIRFYNLLQWFLQNTKKLYFTKDHWQTSVSLNVVNGWTATNIIPDTVKAKFDIRFTEEFSLDEILNQVNKFLSVTNGEIKSKLTWDLLYTDPYNPIIQKYLNIANKYVETTQLDKEHGWSDGRFFSAAWSVVLLHRPSCRNLHWKNEYVVLEDMDIIYKIYKDFIFDL